MQINPLSPLNNYSSSKEVSFGRTATPQRLPDVITGGETYVITRDNIYFQKYKPKDILNGRFDTTEKKEKAPARKKTTTEATKKTTKNKIRSYFLPFRRINQISNKTNDIRYSGGCQFITSVSEKRYKEIDALTTLQQEKRANFWLPGILHIEKTTKFKIHGKNNQYCPLSHQTNTNYHTLTSITNLLIDTIQQKKTTDLVIAIGTTEKDLTYIDPFRRLNLPATKDSFKAIKDLPFRSAFICTKHTPEKVRKSVNEIAQICNSDGNLRFVVIEAGEKFPINKIAHTILLLQKAFANYSKKFRKEISSQLKTLISYRELEHPNIDLTPHWALRRKPEKLSLSKNIKNFLLNNKSTTALILTAIISPIYYKEFYLKQDKN